MKPDHNNPLAVVLPYNFTNGNEYPTEVLAARFLAWRVVLKDIVTYLREYANVQEEIVRQQMRLQQAVGQSVGLSTGSGHEKNHTNSTHGGQDLMNTFFLPLGNGSVQDIPGVLTKYHLQNVVNSSKTLKELNQVIIPKLDELRRDLLVKIKEIKNLHNDFKTNLGKELAETKHLYAQYIQNIELSNKLEHGSHPAAPIQHEGEHGKLDPYLAKMKLDRQLKRQLVEENYLYEAYSNLQGAGGKLESIVVLEIQNYLLSFLGLIDVEHSTLDKILFPGIRDGFLSKESTFEWDSFINRNLPSNSASVSAVGNNPSGAISGTFIDLSFPARKFHDISIPHAESALNVAVREGKLERRSKYLKSYSSSWYVLTCSFIHEFKTPDRKKDMQPVLSLLLDTCQVTDHSRDDGKSDGFYKFVLTSKLTSGPFHRSHNLVFRTNTYKEMIDWYNDIKALTSLPTPASRARYIAKRLKLLDKNKLSRTASLVSNGTNTKSIKTVTTNQSRAATERSKAASARSKAASPAASQATSGINNRLSSTFSLKNANSPRLPNMINSDGTIITPVETYQDERVRQQQKHGDDSSLHPQQQYVQPGFQGGYIIASPGAAPHQFYDPVQQQYYTITPAQPNSAQGQPPSQPQPQYFPTSPQLSVQQQFIPVPQTQGMHSPMGFPQGQFPHYPQQTYSDGTTWGGQLPYPHQTDNSELESQVSAFPPQEPEKGANAEKDEQEEEMNDTTIQPSGNENEGDDVETLETKKTEELQDGVKNVSLT